MTIVELLSSEHFNQYVASPVVVAVLGGLGWWLKRSLGKIQTQQGEITFQVKNHHSTNLREDIDTVTHVAGEARRVAEAAHSVALETQEAVQAVDAKVDAVAEMSARTDERSEVILTLVTELTKRFDTHLDRAARA